MLRFHIPLVEPIVRISRNGLTEEVSRCRPRKVVRPLGYLDQSETIEQTGFRKLLVPRPCHFVFGTQPPTQPFASMFFYGLIGFADWTQAEVVCPPSYSLIELFNHLRHLQMGCIVSSLVANRLTDALYSLL